MALVHVGKSRVHLAGGSDGHGGGDGPLVVLLHGFGAPGDDLVSLARALPTSRRCRFAFPEAPLDLGPLYYGGRAWWWVDIAARQRALAEGRREELEAMEPDGLAGAREALAATLRELRRTLAVGDAPIVLGGFSQGAMLSCDLALRTDEPLAGLLLFSGTLLAKAAWREGAARRVGLKVAQAHGRTDEVLDFTAAEHLRDLLAGAGLDVRWTPFPGGHTIPMEALVSARVLLDEAFA